MNKRLVGAVALSTIVLLAFNEASAHSYGHINSTLRPGDSGNGCGGCHGSSPGVVAVELQGDAAILPGATARYEVIISNITKASALAGFTSAIDKNPGNQPTFGNVPGEPTAIADSATQIVNNNASFPLKAPVNGTAIHLIDLTMPAGASYGETYTIYTVGEAGWSSTQVGWRHAPNFTVTVAPPTPAALTADQTSATDTLIPLQWTGSTQGEHFRVLSRIDDYPDSPTDAAASLVYEGPDTSADATGLAPGQAYYFAAWGKAPDDDIYSTEAALATAATIPGSPDSLIITPLTQGEIELAWTGTSDEYRLLRQIDTCPSSPTDGNANLIYEGSDSDINDAGLEFNVTYCYRVWGKVTNRQVYSENSAEANWADLIHSDRFEQP
jgi:hypothetical protein